MARKPAVSDEALTRSLGLYAGMVGLVLNNPQRWLGLGDDPPKSASLPARALDAVRDRTFGDVTPASPRWGDQPQDRRVDWWVKRIGLSAGLAAAAPRLAGALSDRIPLQAMLGASAAGLAICATAREHGHSQPTDWVPLLAQVLFDRTLAAQSADVPSEAQSEQRLSTPAEGEEKASTGRLATLGRGAEAAARTLWRLGRAFLGVQDLLDERPRGSFLARGLGKLPLVGLAGGWLDERGGIRKAAKETAELLTSRTPETKEE
jgi:hypothetical protein